MALPVAVALSPLLGAFFGALSRFLGSALLVGIFALITEFLPRLFGLGQGLISYGLGVTASVAFSAFQFAFSLGGVELPSFSDLLSGLPAGLVWAGSAMRIHKVVFILVSIPIIKLLRKVMEGLAANAAKTGASALLRGGK